MNFFSKIIDKLYRKQWSIGIVNESIKDVIKNKKITKEITWVPINNNHQFFADPFIFKSESGEYSILYEELEYDKQYGSISRFTLNDKNKVISKKTLLDTKSHLSYPFIFIENDTMYVLPESSVAGKLSCYQYDKNTQSLNFKQDILNLPLLDSTILKFQSKYWIFSTMKGNDSNKKLYIFYSDSIWGPYTPHALNPVKDDINSSRPAGNFIEVEGNIYRPAQGSGKYYGSSIVINKVKELSENTFVEENYFHIMTSKEKVYNFGIHTINYADNKIVVDGLRRRFLPLGQLRFYFLKRFRKNDA